MGVRWASLVLGIIWAQDTLSNSSRSPLELKHKSLDSYWPQAQDGSWVHTWSYPSAPQMAACWAPLYHVAGQSTWLAAGPEPQLKDGAATSKLLLKTGEKIIYYCPEFIRVFLMASCAIFECENFFEVSILAILFAFVISFFQALFFLFSCSLYCVWSP